VTRAQLRTELIGSVLVAHLSGDVDLSNVTELRTRLLGMVDDVDALVVNLTDAGTSTAPAFASSSSPPSGANATATRFAASYPPTPCCVGSSC
jgi:hypothetical protein